MGGIVSIEEWRSTIVPMLSQDSAVLTDRLVLTDCAHACSYCRYRIKRGVLARYTYTILDGGARRQWWHEACGDDQAAAAITRRDCNSWAPLPGA